MRPQQAQLELFGMIELPLCGAKGYVARLDACDWNWASAYRWYPQEIKRKDGIISTVYAVRHKMVRRHLQKFYLHREILGVTDPKIKVDHCDHDGLNCIRSNLRTCSHQENIRNSRLHYDNLSGHKGVNWCPDLQKWCANVVVERKRIHLGYYKTKKEAASIRRAYDIGNFGEFVCQRSA